jgi:hypothetical protein
MRRRELILRSGAGLAGLVSGGPAVASLPAGPSGLQPVIDYLANAEAVAERLGYGDPALRPGYYRQVMLLLSLAYVEVFGTSVDSPVWVPHIPFFLPWGSPNPDDIYQFVPIDAQGRYRLYGNKGTVPIASVTLRTGGAHLGQINGRTLSEIDLRTLPADRHGNFELLLSAARPPDYRGLWFPLHADTTALLFRSRSTNLSQFDADCGIERLDRTAGPAFAAADAMARRLDMLCSYASRQNEFLLGYLNAVRSRGGEQGFVFEDQSSYGALIKQRYLMHLFSLAPDEALILDSEVPDRAQYWSVQLFDTFFSGIDNVGRQSAVNHEQVRIDRDRHVRLVVASQDPGVANWLDTGGWPRAGLMWRWNDASSYPRPAVRKVKLAEVPSVLPPDTPRVDADRRRALNAAHARYTRRRGR